MHPGPPGASWVPWVPLGSPLICDVSRVASPRIQGHLHPDLQKLSENRMRHNFKMLSKMVSKLDIKCQTIRLGTVFFIVEITLISEGSAFSFIMLPGRIGYLKIQRKPCRVSQNRGSAVSPPIRNFSQKVLKIATQWHPKSQKILKILTRGPSENAHIFQLEFLTLFNDLGCHFRVPKRVFFCDFLESGPEGAPGWSQGPLFASSDVTFWSKMYKKVPGI